MKKCFLIWSVVFNKEYFYFTCTSVKVEPTENTEYLNNNFKGNLFILRHYLYSVSVKYMLKYLACCYCNLVIVIPWVVHLYVEIIHEL